MLTFFVVVTSILIMIVLEWNYLNSQDNKKAFWIFSCLLSIGITLWVLRGLGVDIGNPVSLMQKLVQ